MATTQTQSRKTDLTTCSICFETFRVPKHFPCLHSFCERCVHTYITSTFQKGPTNNGVTCPVCRDFVKKPEEVSVEDWAKTLPVNHLLVSLTDMNESQPDNKICNACARENETESAESWCVNCGEALCKQCIRSHRRNKITASHKFTELSDGELPLSSADIYCDDHPDKKLEAYCTDHSVVCCMSCVMLKHRKCDRVGSVDEAVQSLKTSENIVNIEKSLMETKEILETLVQSRKENMKESETSLSEMKKDIEKLFQELTNHLETLKSKTLLEIAALEKEILPELENERDELQCKIAAVENDLTLYHSHMRYASPAQFLQAMERLSEQSRNLKEYVRQQLQELREIEVRFERNENLNDITRATQLGEIKIKKSRLKIVGKLGEELVNMLTVTPELVMKKDNSGSVLGIAVTNEELILISKYTSRRLELWDNQCTLLASLSFSQTPRGIKMISDTEGMVAVQNSMLAGFKIQDKKILGTTNTEVPVFADFILHNEIYFIGSRNRIIVHDISHNHVRDIVVSGKVGHLAVRDATTLCYTLYFGKELYCITMDGAPVFTYSNDNLRGTMGVTVDNTGYIYVCGHGTRNVHQLSHDGKLQRIIFDNLPDNPFCISFNKYGDKAVIGCSDNVLVYKLK